MTINGPAPIILAMFFNAAIEQQKIKYLENKKQKTLSKEEEKRNRTTDYTNSKRYCTS